MQQPPSAAGSRWAVIVGVSTYRDRRLNLEFAADDARELATLIQTPTGGGFPAGNVLVLVDEEATSLGVTRALRSFLMRPSKEDLVLIYFACHGGPDPRRPSGPLYLLTYDTEMADIAATAVPMDEIQGALRDSLLSERVVVIADTCHSGNLGGSGIRAAPNAAEATNSYLSRLAESKGGVAVLTSCEAAESSQEDRRWGGGHGVFTWHLLEGMRGAADGFGQQRDGIVGVGELFEYVRDRVRADTNGAQHPSVGSTAFDRNLPMAATGDLDVQRHLSLARDLVDVGWLTDDPAAFACAVRETESVDELAAVTGLRMPASAALRAEALLAMGRHGDAAALLGGAPQQDEDASTDLTRGVALAVAGESQAAASALARFVAARPDDPEAAWARDFAAALELGSTGTRHALLIGAGTFANIPEAQELLGPRNDVPALADILVNRAGFPQENVTSLVDEEATRSNVVAALGSLAERSRPSDVVVVFFSGHTTIVSAEDYHCLFVTNDTRRSDDGLSWTDGLRGSDLSALLARVRAVSKLFVADSGLRNFPETMSDQHEWVVIGPAPEQISQDVRVDGEYYGALTRALVDTWPTDDPRVTCGALVRSASRWLRDASFSVRPAVYGDPGEAAVAPRFAGARLWWASRDRSRSAVSTEEVGRRAAALRPYGHGAWAIGRTEAAQGRPLAAVRSFEEAGQVLGNRIPLLEADRARALLAAGRPAEAAEAWGRLAERTAGPEAPAQLLAAGSSALTEVTQRRAHALVVGIDAYAAATGGRRSKTSSQEISPPAGARADAEALAASLVRNGVVAREDVVVLLDQDATRDRVLAAFQALAAQAVDDLAVFHFAGLGSWATDGHPTILSVDARTSTEHGTVADIPLTDLAEMAVSAPNLVAIIDAGSAALPNPASDLPRGRASGGQRTAARVEVAMGPVGPRPTSSGDDPVIGAVTIWPAVPDRARDRSVERAEGTSGAVRGRLTLGVERALDALAKRGRQAEPPTYRSLLARGTLRGRANVGGIAADEPILRHRTAIAAADAALRELELRPARGALALASALIGEAATRNEQAPVAHLEAGLALDALGEHAAAADRLRAARALADSAFGVARRGSQGEETLTECSVWASYHLGRILYEHGGDLNEAVAALTAASRQAPDDARTSFHLGLAIHTLVQQESLRDVETHLQRYLDRGAPLGQVERIEAIIDSIENV
ncbi:MAG TPA: caspase family protein [Humibacillus xanthopallidus]|nr:caspase family protein [Humibacillus xanthopallidus]